MPILPKHIWSTYTLDQIGNPEAAGFFKNDPPVVGTGPYQSPSSGSRATSSGSPATPTTGAARAPRTRSSSSTSRSATPMVQALKTGRDRLRPRRRCRPVRRARERAEHQDRRGLLQRLHVPVVQHQGQQRGLRRLDVGAAATPTSVTRSATRSTRPKLVDATLAGHGVAGQHEHPALPQGLARRHRHAAHGSTSRRRSGASTPRATSSMPTGSDSTRTARPSTCG